MTTWGEFCSLLALPDTRPCLTNMTQCCHKHFSQWQHSFEMKAVLPLAKTFVTVSCHYSTQDTAPQITLGVRRLLAHWKTLRAWALWYCINLVRRFHNDGTWWFHTPPPGLLSKGSAGVLRRPIRCFCLRCSVIWRKKTTLCDKPGSIKCSSMKLRVIIPIYILGHVHYHNSWTIFTLLYICLLQHNHIHQCLLFQHGLLTLHSILFFFFFWHG